MCQPGLGLWPRENFKDYSGLWVSFEIDSVKFLAWVFPSLKEIIDFENPTAASGRLRSLGLLLGGRAEAAVGREGVGAVDVDLAEPLVDEVDASVVVDRNA